MNFTVVNMTPHDVAVVDNNGMQIRVFPRSGQTIRCQSKTEMIGDIDGIPMTRTAFGALTVRNRRYRNRRQEHSSSFLL